MRRGIDRITVWCGSLALLGLLCVAMVSCGEASAATWWPSIAPR